MQKLKSTITYNFAKISGESFRASTRKCPVF